MLLTILYDHDYKNEPVRESAARSPDRSCISTAPLVDFSVLVSFRDHRMSPAVAPESRGAMSQPLVAAGQGEHQADNDQRCRDRRQEGGEHNAHCTDHNEDCWQRNRRDDFVIVTIGSDNIVVPSGGEE